MPGLRPTPAHARPRRPWGRLAAVALVVAIAVAIVALLAGQSSTPPQKVAILPRLHHYPGPESMFSPSVELIEDPIGTLTTIKALGVDRVHVYMLWSQIAPDPTSRREPAFDAEDPGAYPPANWTPFDTVVRELKILHMGIDLALIGPPPLWATGPGAPPPAAQHPYWRPSATAYGQWVHAVAVRYSGDYTPAGQTTPLPRVGFWSIYNEPNLGTNIAPQAVDHSRVEVSPRYYRALLNAAWSALRATGHGHDTILIGELGPAGETNGTGPGNFNSMAPLRFLRALYCVGTHLRPLRGAAARVRDCPATAAGSAAFAARNPLLFHASGVADHPYPQGLAPNVPTPDEPDFAELAAIGNLQRTLDRLTRVYGVRTRYPIWSTEFGYQTTPPDTETGTVSPTLAAFYLNWSEYLTWLDPRLRSYDQYLLIDPPRGNFATGLETDTGRPKPAFYAFRMPIFLPVTDTRSGHPLEVWGCVRPAPDAAAATHRRQSAQIQFRPGTRGAFRTVQTVPITNPHGYFDVLHTFRSSGAVRIAWRYPSGPEVFSRTVVISLR